MARSWNFKYRSLLLQSFVSSRFARLRKSLTTLLIFVILRTPSSDGDCTRRRAAQARSAG
jgi:hypothetical protein